MMLVVRTVGSDTVKQVRLSFSVFLFFSFFFFFLFSPFLSFSLLSSFSFLSSSFFLSSSLRPSFSFLRRTSEHAVRCLLDEACLPLVVDIVIRHSG